MVATYIKKIMHNMNCVTHCVFKGFIYMFLISQVSGPVENVNVSIFSDTITVINVKLCVMVLHIALYLLITLSVTLTFQGHSTVRQFQLKILYPYPIKLKHCRLVHQAGPAVGSCGCRN